MKYVEHHAEMIDTTLEAILNKNQPLITSVGRGGERKEFFEMLDKEGYLKAAKKFGGKTNPVKYAGMFLLDKTGMFEKFKRMIKG